MKRILSAFVLLSLLGLVTGCSDDKINSDLIYEGYITGAIPQTNNLVINVNGHHKELGPIINNNIYADAANIPSVFKMQYQKIRFRIVRYYKKEYESNGIQSYSTANKENVSTKNYELHTTIEVIGFEPSVPLLSRIENALSESISKRELPTLIAEKTKYSDYKFYSCILNNKKVFCARRPLYGNGTMYDFFMWNTLVYSDNEEVLPNIDNGIENLERWTDFQANSSDWKLVEVIE